jgi:hypothetical protein
LEGCAKALGGDADSRVAAVDLNRGDMRGRIRERRSRALKKH